MLARIQRFVTDPASAAGRVSDLCGQLRGGGRRRPGCGRPGQAVRPDRCHRAGAWNPPDTPGGCEMGFEQFITDGELGMNSILGGA